MTSFAPSTLSPKLIFLLALTAVICARGNALVVVGSIATLAFVWAGVSGSATRIIIASYLSYQWLQVTAKVWIAVYAGLDLSTPQVAAICTECAFVVTGETTTAICLGLAAIVSTS